MTVRRDGPLNFRLSTDMSSSLMFDYWRVTLQETVHPRKPFRFLSVI
jgi:hypothetical protein